MQRPGPPQEAAPFISDGSRPPERRTARIGHNGHGADGCRSTEPDKSPHPRAAAALSLRVKPDSRILEMAWNQWLRDVLLKSMDASLSAPVNRDVRPGRSPVARKPPPREGEKPM